MTETTTIVTSIIGSAGAIVAILGLMFRSINRQFDQTNRRIDDSRTDLTKRLDDTNRRIDDSRTELKERLDDTNRRIDDSRTELKERLDDTNRRLERVESRVDEIGRDIGELRDRTGKLEGTISTFIHNQGTVEAA